MIRQGLCVLAISGLLACDVNDSAVIVGGVVPGSFDETAGGCTYDSSCIYSPNFPGQYPDDPFSGETMSPRDYITLRTMFVLTDFELP